MARQPVAKRWLAEPLGGTKRGLAVGLVALVVLGSIAGGMGEFRLAWLGVIVRFGVVLLGVAPPLGPVGVLRGIERVGPLGVERRAPASA